ncbi:MAG: amidohydrolase family protein [Alphaproteobacteria bacterium]|nr:amidohydrolase family protein [Alphaproteobacteria bacterium]
MRHVALTSILFSLSLMACKRNPTPEPTETDTDTDTDSDTDTDTDTDADADADADADSDTDTDADADLAVDVAIVETCTNTFPAPPTGELCSVSGDPATATHILIQGDVLADTVAYEAGELLIARGDNGLIECVGCDCASSAPAELLTITCPDGVVSPGLINAHDHIGWTTEPPVAASTERFDHRNDWRLGARNHTDVDYGGSRSNDEARLWGELRMLLGGATSIAASGGEDGLLRNLDDAGQNEGLGGYEANYRTFALGDSGFTSPPSGCDGFSPDAEFQTDSAAYLPHVAEGIDGWANLEFQCMSGGAAGAVDYLIAENTGMIHGVGLGAPDIQVVAERGAKLIWSPRSNVSLYGMTADVTTYRSYGIPIGIGTDWSPSGSGTLLRELQCAEYLDETYYGDVFSDRELWLMATRNGAAALGVDGVIGALRPGMVADITIFDGTTSSLHRAILDADISDVELVLRGSKPLTGDADLLAGLMVAGDLAACEDLGSCVSDHKVCSDASVTLAQMQSASTGAGGYYELYICGAPADEPSCEPFRDDEDGDGIIFPTSSVNDTDFDGIDDAQDNCPTIFNPERPMDGFVQADADADGNGDVCDPCPLDATDSCSWYDADADGIPNGDDNCPDDANPNQEDADGDFIGDLCDACPAFGNLQGACPESIYDVRDQTVPTGAIAAVEGVTVTAVNNNGMFVQLHPSAPGYVDIDYSGMFVFARDLAKPAVGDIVTVTGFAGNYFGEIQLEAISIDVTSSGNPLPDPEVVAPADVANGGTRGEALEGVLVRVENVTVSAVDLPPGAGDSAPTNEFAIDAGLPVNDYLYFVDPQPLVGEQFASITGLLRYGNGAFKIEPRSDTDLVGGPASIASLLPSSVYLLEGTTTDALLAVSLVRPAGADETVSLVCAPDTVLTCPTSITITAGNQTAGVPLTGVLADPTAATVTASLNGSQMVAEVLVYSDASTRIPAEVAPTDLVMAPSATSQVTLTLNVPAPSTGLDVTVTVPGGLATVPSPLSFAADELTYTFDVTSGAVEGTDTITFDIAGATLDLPLTVSQAAAGQGLIFTEYLEGVGGNRKAVEITNISGSAVDLSQCIVNLYRNGATAAGPSFTLSGTLAVDGVYTLCNFDQGAPTQGCDQNESGLTFNGDDALDLVCNTNELQDVIGQIGFQPSTGGWGTGTLSTKDATIHRSCTVLVGDRDGSDVFDPATEWVAGVQNDTADLGTRTCP